MDRDFMIYCKEITDNIKDETTNEIVKLSVNSCTPIIDAIEFLTRKNFDSHTWFVKTISSLIINISKNFDDSYKIVNEVKENIKLIENDYNKSL